MEHDYDVIVVGAGFAGVTAARESALRGQRTLLLEGRQRIGGRTKTEYFDDGTAADMGGTYVHWTQPHLWAEISRYGLTDQVREGIVPDALHGTQVDGETVWVDGAPYEAAAASASDKVLAAAREVFPNPAKPMLNAEALEALDSVSMLDIIDGLDLTPAEREYALTFLSGLTGQAPDKGSYLGSLRWYATGNDNYADYHDMEFGWKLECGTGGLLKLMLADGGAELRLGQVVSAITSGDNGVEVVSNGQRLTAAAVVIATPSSSWLNMELTPPLPPAQLEATREGLQTPSSAKAMVRITGDARSLYFNPTAEIPISLFSDKILGDDEQILTTFPIPMSEDKLTREDVADMVQKLLPHAKVEEVRLGLHYRTDPMSGGANAFYKLGQLTKYRPHEWTNLSDRVFFATSDIATLFNGFIDGAIESGLRASRDVLTFLETQSRTLPVEVELTVEVPVSTSVAGA